MQRPLIKLDQTPDNRTVDTRVAKVVATVGSALEGLDRGARTRFLAGVAGHVRALTAALEVGERVGDEARLYALVTTPSPRTPVQSPDSVGADDPSPDSIIVW